MSVKKPIILDETGKDMVQEMAKQNALLQILAKDSIKTLADDWGSVQRIVRAGSAAMVFDYGDQLTEKWTDTAASKEYDYPFRVNHFENVELKDEENVPAMFLQAHYAHPFGVQFSQHRAFLACPEGLAAGTYYFTIESSWGTYVAAGDIVSFTLTQDVPEGGKLAGCYGAPDQAKSKWKIYSYSADGKTVLETVTPTFEASGENLGVLKSSKRNGNLNSMQETAYGWNRWSTSALRQYLNSSAGVGEWWTAQDQWDIAPDQLTSKAGFLSGVPKELLDVMLTFKTVTYTNTVNDGGEADITYDKVILPSLEQMYIKTQIAGEGAYHEYWKRATGQTSPMQWYDPNRYPELIHYACENHTSPQYVRLRSAYRGGASFAWNVNSTGCVLNYAASAAHRFSPLVAIG